MDIAKVNPVDELEQLVSAYARRDKKIKFETGFAVATNQSIFKSDCNW